MAGFVLTKVARFAMSCVLAWLCSLPVSVGALFVMMATGLQASVFGDHFLLELVVVNTAMTLALIFSYEIAWLWAIYQDEILTNAASVLMIWLLIESAIFAINLALQYNFTLSITVPHWLALLLAVTGVIVVRLRTRHHPVAGHQIARFAGNSGQASQIPSTGSQ